MYLDIIFNSSTLLFYVIARQSLMSLNLTLHVDFARLVQWHTRIHIYIYKYILPHAHHRVPPVCRWRADIMTDHLPPNVSSIVDGRSQHDYRSTRVVPSSIRLASNATHCSYESDVPMRRDDAPPLPPRNCHVRRGINNNTWYCLDR